MLLSRPAPQLPDTGTPPGRLVRALSRAVPHGICIVGPNGVITDVNATFVSMTRLDRGAPVGSGPPFPGRADEHRDACAASLRDALAGRISEADLVLRRDDGSPFPAGMTMSPLAEDGGDSEGIVAVLRETGLENDEHVLLQEARRVARLVSWEYDPGSGTVVLSRELTDVEGGHVPRVTTLERVLTLLNPHDAQMLRERLVRVGGGDGSSVLESELVQPERDLDWALPVPSPRWVRTRMRAIHDRSGARTGGVHGTTQDITARKLADLAGRGSEQRLRETQRVGEVGSFEIDCRTHLVTWSPELFRLFDVGAGACSGDLDFLLGLIPAQDASALARLADAIAVDGRPRELEHRYLRGGEVRYGETRLERLGSGDGRGLRGTLRDVTARRLAQDEAHLRGQLLDTVDAAVIAIDRSAIVTHWSRGAERLYGWTRSETVGRPLRPRTVDAAGPDDGRRLIECVSASAPVIARPQLERKDGARFQGLVRTSLLTDATGAPAGVIAVAVDLAGDAGRRYRSIA